MDLFPSEDYLVQSDHEQIILTTHRIEMTTKDWGSSYCNTLFLEDISSIEVRYTSLFLALALGVVLIAGGFMWANQSDTSPLNISTFAGLISIAAWFFSRKHVVSITPNGGKPINFEIGKMSTEEVDAFVDKVQLAKLARRKSMA